MRPVPHANHGAQNLREGDVITHEGARTFVQLGFVPGIVLGIIPNDSGMTHAENPINWIINRIQR